MLGEISERQDVCQLCHILVGCVFFTHRKYLCTRAVTRTPSPGDHTLVTGWISTDTFLRRLPRCCKTTNMDCMATQKIMVLHEWRSHQRIAFSFPSTKKKYGMHYFIWRSATHSNAHKQRAKNKQNQINATHVKRTPTHYNTPQKKAAPALWCE